MSFQDSGGAGTPGPDKEPSIAEAVQEISERAVSLIQEEIELAKAEISEKFNKLLVGAAVTATAAVFVFWAIAIILFGFVYLVHYAASWPYDQVFWAFFLVGAVLLVIAAIAGYVAFRFFKAGSPPVPTMAIDEAQRIRDAVMPSASPSAEPREEPADEPAGEKLPYDPPVYTGSSLDDEPEAPPSATGDSSKPYEQPAREEQDTSEDDKAD
jgi:uncharacterized membrane protein YqjE